MGERTARRRRSGEAALPLGKFAEGGAADEAGGGQKRPAAPLSSRPMDARRGGGGAGGGPGAARNVKAVSVRRARRVVRGWRRRGFWVDLAGEGC